MSKLSDYSKFDHLDSSDDETDEASAAAASTAVPNMAATSSSSTNTTPSSTRGTTKKHPTEPNRYIFEFSGQKVYEWEQSLEEVTIYIDAPPNLPKNNAAHYIDVKILPNRLQVGLKGFDRYFIDERTFDKVKVKESSWFLDDGVITIVLAKCFRGQTWEGVLCGHHDAAVQQNGKNIEKSNSSSGVVNESIDPLTKQEMQRTMMLERFQEENPGFDFRDATFNGEVPDPRTFMGGVGYNH